MKNEKSNISPATFDSVFQRFREAVVAYPGSGGPFTDFQSGLAEKWEHYKEWLYLEARRLLDAPSWKKASVGSGQILQHVLDAIEIHRDKDHRNNIVEWDGRRGESSKSHRKMLLAKNSAALRT